MTYAERLNNLQNPNNVTILLDLLIKDIKNEENGNEISLLLYNSPLYKRAILRNQTFQYYLPTFINNYPARNENIIRPLINELVENRLYRVVMDLAFKLVYKDVVATFKSFFNIFIGQSDFKGATKLLIKILEAMNDKKPEYTLVMNNLGVMYIVSGELDKSQETYDKLFKTDFSRFDIKESNIDKTMEAIMGLDPGRSYALIHEQYFKSA